MLKKEIVRLSVAFLLGILLTLLLVPNNGRYIPIGQSGRILDTQNGRVFIRRAEAPVWLLQTHKVGKKHNR